MGTIRLATREEEAGFQLTFFAEVMTDRPCDARLLSPRNAIKPKYAWLVSAVCPSFYLFQGTGCGFWKTPRLILMFAVMEDVQECDRECQR